MFKLSNECNSFSSLRLHFLSRLNSTPTSQSLSSLKSPLALEPYTNTETGFASATILSNTASIFLGISIYPNSNFSQPIRQKSGPEASSNSYTVHPGGVQQ